MLRVDDTRSAGKRRFDESTAGITDVAQRPEADAGHRVLAYEFVFHNSHSMPDGWLVPGSMWRGVMSARDPR